QARNLDSVKWEMILIERTAGASWHAVSITDSPEDALALKAKYEQLPDVSRVVEVASLVPAQQDVKLPLLADMHRRLAYLPPRGVRIPHAKPELAPLQESLSTLLQQLPAHAPPEADAKGTKQMTEVHQALIELQGQLARMPMPQLTQERLQFFDEHLAGDLAE